MVELQQRRFGASRERIVTTTANGTKEQPYTGSEARRLAGVVATLGRPAYYRGSNDKLYQVSKLSSGELVDKEL